MRYRYDYQRVGSPMSWRDGPPDQSRAAETRGLGAIAIPSARRGGRSRRQLGSLGGATLAGSTLGAPMFSMPLPAPGAPEPLMGMNSPRSGPPGPFGSDCGCGCGGDHSPCQATGDFELTDGVKLAATAGLAYLAYKIFKRK